MDLQAVQDTAQVAATNAAHSIVSELPANIGAALALIPGLEWAKRSASPLLKWVNAETAPVLAILGAACAAVGIHYSFDHNTGTLMITGLTLTAVLQGCFEVGKQWLTQHWGYKFYQGFDTLKSLAIALDKLAAIPTLSVTQAMQSADTAPSGKPRGTGSGTGDGTIVKP